MLGGVVALRGAENKRAPDLLTLRACVRVSLSLSLSRCAPPPRPPAPRCAPDIVSGSPVKEWPQRVSVSPQL